jgi:hypothetical protein
MAIDKDEYGTVPRFACHGVVPDSPSTAQSNVSMMR